MRLIDLDAIARFCKKHQVKTFAPFGSILRDDFDEDSDVDVLVDLDGRHLKFHEECRMLDELELVFRRKVDSIPTNRSTSPTSAGWQRKRGSARLCVFLFVR
jgi:predicted nucleotidyltransferase